MMQEILQFLSQTSAALRTGILSGAFLMVILLGAGIAFAVGMLHRRRKSPLARFCRWKGMHVPCFDVLSTLDDCVIVADASGKLVFLNASAEKILGVSIDSVRGCHYSGIVHIVEDAESDRAFDPFAELKKSGKPISISRNMRVFATDGKTFRTADRIQAIFRSEAMEPHMIMVLHDGTEQLTQKARLNSALNAFEYAFELTSTALFRFDPETREMSGAQSLGRLWPIHDGRGAVWRDVIHPDDQEEFERQEKQLLDGQIEKMILNYRAGFLGETRYYRMEAGLDRQTGHRTTIVGIIQDVTDDKLREERHSEELKRQNSILNAILSSIPSQVFIKDAQDDFRYKLANRNFTEYYRMSENDVVGHSDFEIFAPEVAKQLREHDTAVCAASGKVFRFDEDISYHLERKEIFKSLKVSFQTEDGHTYLLGVCLDITEMERAKRQVEENAARLQAYHEQWSQIINSTPTLLFAKDPGNGFRYVLCNQAFASFLGKTPEEIVGKTDAELLNASDVARQFEERDRHIIHTKAPERYEESVTNFNGEKHFFRSFKRPIIGIDKRELLFGVSVDITEMHNLLQYEQVSNKVLTCAVTETEFAPAIEKTLRIMMECLNCDRAVFARMEADGLLHRFKSVYSNRAKPLETAGLERHEKFWNLHQKNFRNREILLFQNFRDIQGSADILKCDPDYPIHSAAGAPVFIGEEFAGILIVSFVERHVFSELDRQTLSAITNMIALTQLRERQTQAVKLAEKHNQTILDNLDIPVWLYDTAGLVVRSNRAADAMIKDRSKSIDNVPFGCRDKLVCGVDEEHCPVRLCMLTGREHECDDRHIGNREFIAKARPIFDESGKVINVVKSYIDVTLLHHMIDNQKLINGCLATLMREKEVSRAFELSLRAVCAHMGADRGFIMQFNSERKTISTILSCSISGRLPELTQYREKPYAELPDLEDIFRERQLLAVPNLREELESCGLQRWKSLVEQSDARSFYAHRIKFNGGLWGFIGFFYENHPKHWAVEELNFFGSLAYCVELALDRQKNQDDVFEALEKAKAADHAKSIFLASMSHEIRTPLNAVIGFSELLKDGTLPPAEQKEYLGSIYSAGNSLLALINDVLDLSKLEAGQMEFSNTPVSFAELLMEVGGIFKQKCVERNLMIGYDIPDDLPILHLDKLRVRQILFNLIGNAVKFTERGGITIKAQFTPETQDCGTLVFHVIDTGCGISAKDGERVFKMFVQAAALRGTQAASGGTGLGLAICKRLTEQMDGSIELASEPGKGSDFFVTLRNIRFEQGKDVERETEVSSAMASRIGGLRVLLVDDVPMNLKVMTAMLKKMGLRSVSVASAKAALELLKKEKFDFVLTDMWMPEMNGAQLSEAIRNGSCQTDIPIFAVTADIEAKANFQLKHFSGILLKPVTVEKLKKILIHSPATPELHSIPSQKP